MSSAIEVEGLRKRYRPPGRAVRQALDSFDMTVGTSQIHGFLGPNGSGKTTTLRILLGLVKADAGQMRIFGEPIPDRLPAVIGRVGAIVESPRFFGNFSGRRTLELLAMAGGVPRSRVDQVLDLVDLTDRSGDPVKAYSLGMKQRLAMASALLKSPDLLILDEPANGLDPAGIRAMRDLMRTLAARGTTIVVSSHILAEIQHLCDSVTIIARGRRVVAGPVAEVVTRGDAAEFRVRVGDLDAASTVLRAMGATVRPATDHLTVSGITDPARITETLGTAGLWVTELHALTPDLEHVFLDLTGGSSHGALIGDLAPEDACDRGATQPAIDLGVIT